MTTRTFKQLGVAYGAGPTNITAKIDNVVVYQGPVTTLNEPFPELPNAELQLTNELFTWTNDVTYAGSAIMEISVEGTASLLVANTVANFTSIPVGNTGNTTSSGPDGFVGVTYNQFGNTYVDGQLVPSSTINHDSLSGQWWFTVKSDFVENITITSGLE